MLYRNSTTRSVPMRACTLVYSLTHCSGRPRPTGGRRVTTDDGANASHSARPDQLCQQGLRSSEEHCLAAVRLPQQVKVCVLLGCALVLACSAEPGHYGEVCHISHMDTYKLTIVFVL